MSSPSVAAVTYRGLPVSSGGAHTLARVSPRGAYQRTLDFLDSCAELEAPLQRTLQVMEVPDLEPSGWGERELARRFGTTDPMSVEDGQVDDALAFMEEIAPQPVGAGNMAPIWFSVECRFRAVDPGAGSALPVHAPDLFAGKEYEWGIPLGVSHLYLSISSRARLALDLSLPDLGDEPLADLVSRLQDNLPFRFSPKHWRRWTPTKSGSFTSRKIPQPGR